MKARTANPNAAIAGTQHGTAVISAENGRRPQALALGAGGRDPRQCSVFYEDENRYCNGWHTKDSDFCAGHQKWD